MVFEKEINEGTFPILNSTIDLQRMGAYIDDEIEAWFQVPEGVLAVV